MSNERDELADLLAKHEDCAFSASGVLVCSCGTAMQPNEVMDDLSNLAAHQAETILAAGYRKVFDGDCGLSNVKDPTDREATEAWMRWANLVSGEEPDGIAAMKQMLTEFGYRKPRTITTAAELDALPVGSVVLHSGRAFQHYPAYPAPFDEYQQWKCGDGGFVRSTKDGSSILPATVLHEPEATK